MQRRGWPRPALVGHAELLAVLEGLGPRARAEQRAAALAAYLEDAGAPVGRPAYVRIDAAGEDPEVERALLRLGFASLEAPDEVSEIDGPDPFGLDLEGIERIDPTALAALPQRHGQILAPRQHHLGFTRYLAALDGAFASQPQWRQLNPIDDVRALFDKRALSRRYASAGLPVPDALPTTTQDPQQLRAAMAQRRWPSVYVKLSCASSASCLALYRHYPPRTGSGTSAETGAEAREVLVTTVARQGDARFNSLRLQKLEERGAIDDLLTWLLAQGAQIERALPKLRLDGRSCDLRVLMVAGEPAFTVVRTSRHPITNLHLGGQRGDLDALQRQLSPGAWEAAMASCRAAARLHGCHHLGVDLAFEAHASRHAILEANAFGDLLPRLERGGMSVYAWQLARLPPLAQQPASA